MARPTPLHLLHLAPIHRLPSLQEKGLDPAFCREHPSRPRAVYLAADAPHALGYENHHGDWPEGGILLRVAWNDLDGEALAPDDVDLADLRRDWASCSARASLRISGQCRCLVAIPPDQLEASPDRGETWHPLPTLRLDQAPSPG